MEFPSSSESTGEQMCNECGAMMRAGVKFCGHCGTPMPPPREVSSVTPVAEAFVCRKCSAQLPPTAKFCPRCGTGIVDEGSMIDEEVLPPKAPSEEEVVIPRKPMDRVGDALQRVIDQFPADDQSETGTQLKDQLNSLMQRFREVQTPDGMMTFVDALYDLKRRLQAIPQYENALDDIVTATDSALRSQFNMQVEKIAIGTTMYDPRLHGDDPQRARTGTYQPGTIVDVIQVGFRDMQGRQVRPPKVIVEAGT